MIQSEVLNLNSLSLVSDELVITIEQSATKLEQFVADRENKALLGECIAGIEQIAGTMKLVQLFGADLLAEEILELARSLLNVNDEDIDDKLSVLTSAFFILPRYLEYAQQTRRGMPVLLLPYINELRHYRRAALLPECHFISIDVSAAHPANGQGTALEASEFTALIRRLRHMYQVGLLKVLQGKQARAALGIMARAMERLEAITGDRALGKLWWAAAGAMQALASSGMELTKSRKLLLTAIDRQIKSVEKEGAVALDAIAPDEQIAQLVYITALSSERTPHVEKIVEHYGVSDLGYCDSDLRRERESLKGPNVNTVASVAAVLKDELRATKDILENGCVGGTAVLTDYDELISTLNKVAEILSVVGLTTASNTLKEEVVRVESWKASGDEADAKDLVDVADALLYVESTVSGLENLNLSDERLVQANTLARREVIASNQLAEAELLVIKEAESGLAMVKRALSSFSDSSYDRGHIQNVGSTLNAVRGGMIVLNQPRAAAVVAACVEFVNETLMQNDQPAALRQLLETFADAVIGLEYYLDSVRTDKDADDSVLEIAEESLQALGHRVELT